MVVCAGCGAYAEGRRRRLALSCPGRPPSAALAAQRTRFWSMPSRHPAARSRQVFAGEPWPLGRSSSPAEDRDAARRDVRLLSRRASERAARSGERPVASQKRPRLTAPSPAGVRARPPAVCAAPAQAHVGNVASSAPLVPRGTSEVPVPGAYRDGLPRPPEPPPASPAKRLRPNEASGSRQCRPSSEAGPSVGSKRPPPAPTPADDWSPPAAEPRASALRRRYGR